MGAKSAVYFISSDDDFITSSRARELFEELCDGLIDEMSKEVIDGAAGNVDEALSALASARMGASTLSLFGERKVVWLKGVTFIGEGRVGNSETLREELESFAEFLKGLSAEHVSVLISASPVDRRKKFFKDLQKIAECEDTQKGKDPMASCVSLIGKEARKFGLKLGEGAAETLALIVGGSARMASQEIFKLASYAKDSGNFISEKDVVDMVPVFGEGDFFEISNAFYSGDLNSALSALGRYFFTNKNASARPVIATIQKQNSMLVQLRSMMEAGAISKGAHVQSNGAIERAAPQFEEFFRGVSEKSAYNVFSQNAWYAGSKLAPIAGRFSLKKLLDFQLFLIKAFEDLISRPGQDEAILRDFFVRCCAK